MNTELIDELFGEITKNIKSKIENPDLSAEEGGMSVYLTGQKIGALEILGRFIMIDHRGKKKSWHWCLCDCGKLVEVRTEALQNALHPKSKRSYTKTCGSKECKKLNRKHSIRRSDLVGQRFEMLVVISFSHKDNRSNCFWLCLCDCGSYKTVRGSHLTNGQKSCGCLNPRIEIGQRYNRYVVIDFSHKNKHNTTFWKCLCDCGTVKVVEGARLVCGETKSCGCYLRDKLRAAHKVRGKKNLRKQLQEIKQIMSGEENGGNN